MSGAHEAALLDDRQERVGIEQPAGRVLPAHERLGAERRCRSRGRSSAGSAARTGACDERGVEVLDRLEPGAVGRRRAAAGRARRGSGRPWPRTSRRRRAAAGRRSCRLVSSRSATPALASTRTRAPSMTSGCVSRSRIRSAIWRPSSPGPSAIRSANSSPAQPDEQVGGDRAGREASRDLAQQLVAGVVAEGVVDLLEVVEVDQDQREPLGAVRGLAGAASPCSKRARRLPRPVSSSVTAWRRASERRWTCRKPANVRAAASSSVNVASATTRTGSLTERGDHQDDDRGRAWPASGSPGSPSSGRTRPRRSARGRQIARAMHVTPSSPQDGQQRADDVECPTSRAGRTATSAAQKMASPPASHSHIDPPRRPAHASRPQIIATSSRSADV